MKREGMLYRYLRDYTPSSPMQSPLEPPLAPYPYDDTLSVDDEDSTNWWTTNESAASLRRESSPSVDPMDTTGVPTPITISSPSRRGSMVVGGGDMSVSPMNVMPPPPIIPHVQRMKRKGTSSSSPFLSSFVCVDGISGGLWGRGLIVATGDYGSDATNAIKRRHVSPGSSPLLSPIAIGGRERRVLNLQDTHNGLEKMSLQD